jgi:hypothetical protein
MKNGIRIGLLTAMGALYQTSAASESVSVPIRFTEGCGNDKVATISLPARSIDQLILSYTWEFISSIDANWIFPSSPPSTGGQATLDSSGTVQIIFQNLQHQGSEPSDLTLENTGTTHVELNPAGAASYVMSDRYQFRSPRVSIDPNEYELGDSLNILARCSTNGVSSSIGMAGWLMLFNSDARASAVVTATFVENPN